MIRTGMVGYNDGNGHPYSFSAIINGYNESAFKGCPFPVINEYLKARPKSEFGVGDLRITHVWTPFTEISRNIAAYASIDNVVNTFEDMIESIDAVIIARDDAECHREIASAFLRSGIKVFIDKPLCKSLEDLNFFIPYVDSGQLMSCSGLRFYPGIQQLANLSDDILFAHCVAPLDWFKYGIHALEGVVPLFKGNIVSVQNIGIFGSDVVKFEFESGKFIIVQVHESVSGGIRSTIYSSGTAPVHIHFNDNFACFKAQLQVFSDLVSKNTIGISPKETTMLIRALIMAEESRLQNSKVLLMNEPRK